VIKNALSFEVVKHQLGTLGRAGVLHTPHGDIETPAFVAVGTKGTVKSLKSEDLKEYVGAQIALANTYHLYLQPGHEVVKEAGGIHSFSNWQMPTMTDSGGFQVFSLGAAFGKGVTKFAAGEVEGERDLRPNVYSKELAENHGKLCVIDEEGVTFTSHLDGSMHRFTSERSIEIQHAIGADIMFAFDECTSPTADYEYQREAMERTHRWAKRSILMHKYLVTEEMKQRSIRQQVPTPFVPESPRDALRAPERKVWGQGLYGIVQGGRHLDLRQESARILSEMDFDGFGIGGSFSKEDLGESLKAVNKILPDDKPRHLLGIGEPDDIAAGVAMGCDTFDCVAPTRLARTGTIYTHANANTKNRDPIPVFKKISLMNSQYQRDFSKVDEECDCYVCEHYTKAYLAHLFRAKEMLAAHLASIHNLYIIVNFTKKLREEIIHT